MVVTVESSVFESPEVGAAVVGVVAVVV